MGPLSFWHDLSADHGVLELDETLTGPGPPLELHVVIDSETHNVVEVY